MRQTFRQAPKERARERERRQRYWRLRATRLGMHMSWVWGWSQSRSWSWLWHHQEAYNVISFWRRSQRATAEATVGTHVARRYRPRESNNNNNTLSTPRRRHIVPLKSAFWAKKSFSTRLHFPQSLSPGQPPSDWLSVISAPAEESRGCSCCCCCTWWMLLQLLLLLLQVLPLQLDGSRALVIKIEAAIKFWQLSGFKSQSSLSFQLRLS